ncbi:MAG: long-chain fatty acid--CoA ligase [Candidatus Jordarchaeaceae archaeon]
MSKKSKVKPSKAKPSKAKKAAKVVKTKGKELPDYIKNRIWLKKYPPDLPKEVKIPDDKSIPELAEEAADKWPDSVNIIFYEREFTRKEFKNYIDRLATAFQKNLGIRKGDKIAIYLPNCPQFIIAYMAGLASGATMTCISPLFVPRELAYQLKDSGAETLVTMDMFYNNVGQIRNEVKLKNIIITNIMGQTPSVPESVDQGIYHMTNLIKDTAPDITRVKFNPKKDIAVIQYTGGTTGMPKGALLTHYNLIANAHQIIPITEALKKRFNEDRVRSISVLPWYHIYGQTCEIIAGNLIDSTAVVFPQFDPGAILDAINKYKPWLFLGVSALLIALMNHPKAQETDFSCLKYVNMGAAPTPDEVARQWKKLSGHPLSEGYGLTEASPVTHTRPAELFGEKLGSIGPPIPNTLAGIVDPDTNEFLPIGELGELVISGPQVMLGYYNRPKDTEAVFFEAGGYKWLKTGDLARMDEDGYFYIVDRTKDIIKYKGHSVYPREIEEVIFEHPAVLECAVIGIPDPEAGENIKAYISLKPDYKGKITEEEMKNWIKERVAAYKYPRYVEFIDVIPKTIVGKVLRRALREREGVKSG